MRIGRLVSSGIVVAAMLGRGSAWAGSSAKVDVGGVPLVFDRAALPTAEWFDIMAPLDADGRRDATAIIAAQAAMYPPGWLAGLGLSAMGVFAGLADETDDGYRTYDEDLGGYPYFGVWNGQDALAMAYYSDGQLPLTFHHEVFHHIDAASGSATDDDARFAAAIAGRERYPALTIAAADVKALRAAGDGAVLTDAVSAYAAKTPGEDQAETARYLMAHLADGLVQMATQPRLAGSQRMLHVLAQFAAAEAPGVAGPDAAWLVGVALGRPATPATGTVTAAERRHIDDAIAAVRAVIAPDGAFVVRGRPVGAAGNPTLQRDILTIAAAGRALAGADRGLSAAARTAAAGELRALLAAYQAFIAARWTLSTTTAAYLTWTDADVQASLGGVAAPAPTPTPAPAPAPRDNPYLANVDAELPAGAFRTAIRAVQPAAVRLGGGSGVNLDPRGVVLTAAHVVDNVGKRLKVLFPDGTAIMGEATVVDTTHDLAIVELDGADADRALPWAPIADAAPTVGTAVVAIGQPGTRTPDGEPTGYQPWTVSVGEIRGYRDGARTGEQGLGRTKHDAWTYWGHSGCPLFDRAGTIVALHNSWDSRTAMRHAVTWEAITAFLDEADVDVAAWR